MVLWMRQRWLPYWILCLVLCLAIAGNGRDASPCRYTKEIRKALRRTHEIYSYSLGPLELGCRLVHLHVFLIQDVDAGIDWGGDTRAKAIGEGHAGRILGAVAEEQGGEAHKV